MAARTVPTMPSWGTGALITSSLLNQITAYAQFWANPPMFRMRQGTAQSIPTGGSPTIVTMDTPEYDTDSGRSVASPFSYVIPTGMSGRWYFMVHVPLNTGTSNERDVYVMKNGSPVVGGQETMVTGSITSQISMMTIPVNAGDVIAAGVYQQSGAAINTFISSPIMPTFEGRLVSLASP